MSSSLVSSIHMSLLKSSIHGGISVCKNAVIFIEVIKMVPCELHWMAEMPCGLQVAGTTVLVSR